MTSSALTKVMLVDDHDIMRDGLREVLERSGDFQVVGEAGDGEEAVRVARELRPEVIIMDVMMPVKDGIEACRELAGILPETRILMLTASAEEDAVVESFAAGATGYLQKYSGKEQLLGAARDLARGVSHIPHEVVRRAFAGIREGSGSASAPRTGALTDREVEILTLFSQGLTYAEIADVRGNKWVTIRNAVYGIQNKLGIRTKQELVVWAVRNGLLDDWDIGGETGRSTKEGRRPTRGQDLPSNR